MIRRPPRSTLFPYTDALPIFAEAANHRRHNHEEHHDQAVRGDDHVIELMVGQDQDRKSTRLNSSHANISYAVFCLKKKKKKRIHNKLDQKQNTQVGYILN